MACTFLLDRNLRPSIHHLRSMTMWFRKLIVSKARPMAMPVTRALKMRLSPRDMTILFE